MSVVVFAPSFAAAARSQSPCAPRAVRARRWANPAVAAVLAFATCAATNAASAQTASAPAAAAAPSTAASTLPSGVVFKSLREGSGAHPSASDTVSVHYRGTLANGTEFDSSYKRGQPASFPLGGVIPCWTEGVQLMRPGGKAQLVCPPATAYGERGAGGVIPPNATLTFEVELLSIGRR